MSWQGQMGTIVRALINDTDPENYTYSNNRIESTILVAAQLSQINANFAAKYEVNVETCQLKPDPTDDPEDTAFITLVSLKAACIIVSGEYKKAADCAIYVKDGPSALDKRGVPAALAMTQNDLCSRYEQLLLEYRAGNSIAGTSILGPYSAGSDLVSRNYNYGGHRAGGYFDY